MSDHEEVEPFDSAIRKCACGLLAFEPVVCSKCEKDALDAYVTKSVSEGYRRPAPSRFTDELCTDCREECEVCGDAYCKEHIEVHGCKRKADPADVMVLSGAYEWNPLERIGEVYSINGRTYYTIEQRMRHHSEPADVTVYRYSGVTERDVSRNDTLEARQFLNTEEVGRFNGMTGKTEWYDEQDLAEDDHAQAEA